MLLVAVVLQAIVMLIFATAAGVPQLFVARILQGISTGAAAGAVAAALLDLNKAKGTLANAVGPTTGTAVGAIGSGLLAQYLPEPKLLVYLLLLLVFSLQALGVLLMAETYAVRPGALASLQPKFALPPTTRRPFFVAVPALVAAWSLAGLYGSLGPALVRPLVGANSLVLGGALFVFAGSGTLTVLLLRTAAPHLVLILGTVALVAGVGSRLLAIAYTSATAFFVGTAVAGSGFGACFQGALRTVLPLAEPDQRGGVLSLLYVASYLALGLPAVIAGFLVVHGGGVQPTARLYG